MKFSGIKGNEQVCKALAGMVDSGRIPHAILLPEDDGGGAMSVAQAFLQYLFCLDHQNGDSCGVCPSCNKISKLIHPDVHYIFPVSGGPSSDYIKEFRRTVINEPEFTEARLFENLGLETKSSIINVAESKALLDTLSLSALEGGWKAVVIYLPERMNKEAGNRLLKSIEEPPAHTQFVLVSHAPEQVLPTILSRCQRIRMIPPQKSQITDSAASGQYSEILKSLMSSLVSRDLLAALEAGERIAGLPSRDNMKSFCKFASDVCRDMFLYQQGLSSLAGSSLPEAEGWAGRCRKTFPRGAMAALSRAKQMIERNVNQKIVFTDLVDRLFLIV